MNYDENVLEQGYYSEYEAEIVIVLAEGSANTKYFISIPILTYTGAS
jgi:hypothetical protein